MTTLTTPPSLSVLLVDDDLAVLKSLIRVVRGPFHAHSVTSPVAALELLRARPDDFFAIVTDVHMPEMDGATFLHRARLIAPSARTILISGALDADVLLRVVNGPGVFRAFLKPVPPLHLRSALEDAWRAYRGSVPASRNAASSVGALESGLADAHAPRIRAVPGIRGER